MTSPLLDAGTLRAHAEGLRRLARSLTHGDAEAEDVVQETLTAAVVAGPGRPQNLGAWLRGTVRRVAGKLARSEGRRRRREAGLARETAGRSVPAAAEAVERLDTQRQVLDAVRRLAEPYRYAILLRYVESLSPAVIAERQEVPLDTARSWVRRGLALLRADLTARHGGDDRTWRAALLPLGSPLLSSMGAGAALVGGLAVKKVLVGLTALLVVGLTVEHFVHAPSSARPNAATAIGHEPATTAPGLRLEGTALQPGDASGGGVSVPSRASVPEESIATTHELVGSIVLPEAVDATSTMLEVRGIPALGHKILSMTLAGTLAEDRRYRLDVSPLFAQGVELVEVDIKAEHSQCLPASTRALVSVARAPEGAPPGSPRQLRADLELHLAATVSGRVLDSVGAPRKGALVTLIPVPRADPAPATEPPADEAPPPPRPLSRAWSASPSDEALTDVEGRYRVRAGAKGEYLIVAAQPGLRPAVAQVELVPGVPYTAADLTLAEGETLEGQVLIDGEPAVGVTVSVWRRWQEGEDRGLSLQPLGAVTVGVVDGSADVDRVSVMTQTDGRFLATGLARAAYVAEPSLTSGGVRAHQSLMEQVRREVLVPGLPVRIEIGGARLDVHVTHEGRGVVRAEVAVTARGTFSLATDGEGHARLRIAPGMNHTIQVFARGLAPVERDLEVPADAEGRTFAVEIALEEARSKPGLRITLRTPDGTAVTSAAVRLSQRDPARPEGTHWQTLSRANLTASDGVFAWEGVPSGASVLHVLRAGGVAEAHYGQGFWLPVATEVEVPSEGYGTVTLDLRAGGRLRVAARSPDGRYLPAGCTLHDAEGAQVQVAFIEHLGGGMIARPSLGRSAPSLADPPVPAGRYTLRIEHEGFQTKSVEASVEAGKVTDMDVALAPK